MAWEGWHYAVQRIDLLIISISGAGVYICLETLKYHHQNPLKYTQWIKAAGLLLVVSILVNLISQFTGKAANEYDLRMSQLKIECDEEKTDSKISNIAKLDTKSEIYSQYTDWLNMASFIIMVAGLSIVIGFFMISL